MITICLTFIFISLNIQFINVYKMRFTEVDIDDVGRCISQGVS